MKPKKKGLYCEICEKTVLAHEFWGDNQYFGSLRPRTALQWHGACYFLWGTILAWGAQCSFVGGTAPECPPQTSIVPPSEGGGTDLLEAKVDFLKFWCYPLIKREYPCLYHVIRAAFTIFYRPGVESSFSRMQTALSSKPTTHISAFTAIQTVKYHFSNENKSLIKLFGRKDKSTPIDKMMCADIPGPAPRGEFRMTACAPPNENCAPKKLTVSGLLECKSRHKTPKLVFTARIFVIFVDSHRISLNF